MKNRLSNLFNISDKKKAIKTLCVIIIGIFLITNGVNAGKSSYYVEDSILEGYEIVDSMVFDASSFLIRFFKV